MPDLLERLTSALGDRYTIEREIGRGGMATVYLAEDLKHHRKVAIKVFDSEVTAALGAERFLHEIEIVAGLQHPHILPLYDSGEANGLLFYVMPYAEGESLRNRLDREGQLPVDESVRIAVEVADGLGYAHGEGVIHRDIKPGNIMLSRGHAVIADFGIAHAMDRAGGERLTQTGMATGSPVYMSPEQARGGETLDGRTDLYSLGCVLYEMLAGEPPFTGGTQASITARKELGAAPHLKTLRETVPVGLERAVEKALAKVAADRFTSADEFTAALSAPAQLEPRRRGTWALVAVVCVSVIATIVWLLAPRAGSTVPDDPRSIAVLPFQSRSSGEDSDNFTHGVHDHVLAQLSKIDSLTVISRTSVSLYASTTKTIPEIAGELGVGSVLEGSVQLGIDRVQINVTLIDAASDRHIWAETYDQERTAANVFDIQVDVAKQIARELKAELTPEAEARLSARPTQNLEAYSLYTRGRQSLNLRTKEGFEAAIDYFQQALARDSIFANAWAGLSEAHGLAAYWGHMASEEAVPVARTAAERAVELNEGLAEAHTALYFLHFIEGDLDGQERELLRALELDPNYATAHHWYGTYLDATGRTDEAVDQLLRARELDPLSGRVNTRLSNMLLRTFRYQEALEAADRTTRLLPDYAGGYAMKAFILMALGRFDEARPAAERVKDLDPLIVWSSVSAWLSYWERDYDAAIRKVRGLIEENPDDDHAYRLLGLIYTAQGRYAEAMAVWDSWIGLDPIELLLTAYTHARAGDIEKTLEILAELEDLLDEPGREDSLADAALVYGALGEHDRAFELLDRAVEARASGLVFHRMGLMWLEVDPWADPLRDDPRFEMLMERIRPH